MSSHYGNGLQDNILYYNDLDSDSDESESSIPELEQVLPLTDGVSGNEQNVFTFGASATQGTHSNVRNESSILSTSTKDIPSSELPIHSSFGTTSTENDVSKESNTVSFQSGTSNTTRDTHTLINTHSFKGTTSNCDNTPSVDSIYDHSFIYDSVTMNRDALILDNNSSILPPRRRAIVLAGRGSAGNITASEMQFPSGNGLGLNNLPFLPSFLFRGGSIDSDDPDDPEEGLSRLHSDTLSRLRETHSSLERLLGIRRNGNFDAGDFLELLSGQEPDASSYINLERLPTKKYVKRSAVEDEQCDICSEPYVVGDEQKTLTCFHDYHTACIDMWLQKNNTCPVCRMEVHTEGD